MAGRKTKLTTEVIGNIIPKPNSSRNEAKNIKKKRK